MIKEINLTPLYNQEYLGRNDKRENVWEVLEKVIDPIPSIPIRSYYLIINTKGEIDLIYYAIGHWHQSIYAKDRW